MTTKDHLHRFVYLLPGPGETVPNLSIRIERVRQEAERDGLPGKLADRLLQVLDQSPVHSKLVRLAHWAEVEAGGDSAKGYEIFVSAVMADPELLGDTIEDFLRALTLVSIPKQIQPAVMLSEAAARLWDLPLAGDGFADDLEAIQAAQQDEDTASWLP